MSETNQPVNRPSATRFNLKSLLALMAVVAIGASLVGSRIRAADESVKSVLQVYFSCAISLAILLVVFSLWLRLRAERDFGKEEFCVAMKVLLPFWLRLFIYAVIIIFFSSFAEFHLSYVSRFEPGAFLFLTAAWIGSISAAILSQAILDFLWTGDVRIGDRGIIQYASLRRWNKVSGWLYKGNNTIELRFSNKLGRDTKFKVVVDSDQEEALMHCLQEKVADSLQARSHRSKD